MNSWMSIPRFLLVSLLLVGGTLLVIFFNPPYSICDSQIEVFKTAQTGFLYLNPKEKLSKTAQVELLTDRCKQTNSPGGCYELFLKFKGLLGDLERVPKECSPQVSDVSEVKKALGKQMKLMVELAWGMKPPLSFNEKLGWLDAADLALFCRLKRIFEEFYGKEGLSSFVESMFQGLPGAISMPRERAWEMMLLSTNCTSYM